MSYPQKPIREALLVAAVCFAVFAVLKAMAAVLPMLAPVAGSVIPLVFFWVPMVILLKKRRSPDEYGLGAEPVMASLRVGLLTAAVILPVFVLGYWLWWGWWVGKSIGLHGGWPLLRQIPVQLLVVAIPEELFFRGYLQTLLAKGWKSKSLPLVGEHAWAILGAAALFAIAHFVTNPQIYRFGVFFPALLFGVLRARTRSLAAPIAMHLLANLTIYLLEGKI